MARPRTSHSRTTALPGDNASDPAPTRSKRATAKAAARAPALNAETLTQLGAPRLAETAINGAELA